MKKNGQLIGKPVLYLLAAIIVLLILAFSYTQIQRIIGFTEQGQLKSFKLSLEDNLKKYASGRYGGKGSIKEETFSLPKDIEAVCFVDRDKEIDFLANNELNSYMARFNDSNLFLKPFNKFMPYRLEHISLDEQTNPLCIKAVNSRINLRLTNIGNGKTKIESREVKDMDVECKKKLYHGDNRMDIVFLPYGYDDKEDFSADIDYYMDNIFMKIEPFKTKINRLNIYMIDNLVDLGCSIGSWIKCDDFKVKQLASNCPNDYIVVLVERNEVIDLLNPVRSSVTSNTAKINTADNKLVLAHELGHLLAKLADEYVDESHYKGIFDEKDYPNCDKEECSKWSGIYGTGCFKGCSLGIYFRPTEDSIMKSFRTSVFGPVNREEIAKVINAYS